MNFGRIDDAQNQEAIGTGRGSDALVLLILAMSISVLAAFCAWYHHLALLEEKLQGPSSRPPEAIEPSAPEDLRYEGIP